jgi:hypothetical protein
MGPFLVQPLYQLCQALALSLGCSNPPSVGRSSGPVSVCNQLAAQMTPSRLSFWECSPQNPSRHVWWAVAATTPSCSMGNLACVSASQGTPHCDAAQRTLEAARKTNPTQTYHFYGSPKGKWSA